MAKQKQPTVNTQNKTQLPPWLQGNLDQYKIQQATAQDLAKRYGFDYSPNYANRIAESEAQAKRGALQNQIGQLDNNLKGFQQSLDQDYFLKGLNQLQNQTNSGMNSGISADQNLRLGMNKQNAMADYMRNDQQQRNVIQQQLGQIETDKINRAENIFQERLQQMFQNSMALNEDQRAYLRMMMEQDQFNKGQQMDWYKFNNLSADQQMNYKMAEKQLQEQIRQFNSEQAWREYTYKNMSAAEQAELNWNIEKYGKEYAWEQEKMKLTMNMTMQQSILGSDLDPDGKRSFMDRYASNFWMGQ